MRFTLGAYEQRVSARVAALADGAAERIWNHDATFWGGDTARQASVANRLGWLDVATQMRGIVGEIETFARQVRDDGFTDAVLLGLGGSSLAPEVLRQSITQSVVGGWPRLHVLDTTDPATILAVSDNIDPAHTLFFVSSKSGTTIEALSLFAYFHALVEKAKPGTAGENFVAITDEGTPLETLATEHGFRRVFTNPGDIGGRYSALSYFGLVPAAVIGVDVGRLLDRGMSAAADARAQESDAIRLGAALGELALAGRDKCTFLISQGIASFGLWVEQLIAESTGKEGRGVLPVANEPPGVAASYGSDRVFVQLRLGGAENASDEGLMDALAEAGHPVIVIDLDHTYDLGREFFTWEFAVAVAGHVLELNPFDEPNVQESKDNTNRVLASFDASGTLDLPLSDPSGISVVVGGEASLARSLENELTALFDSVPVHGYLAITAYIQPAADRHRAFDIVRAAIRDARACATTLGFGPRFLHSTGQFHKGGPLVGAFLQITTEDRPDIAIPDKPFTFGQLKRAQGIGDFQSLISHGRPVVRVHLGDDIDRGLAQLVDAVRNAVRAAAGR